MKIFNCFVGFIRGKKNKENLKPLSPEKYQTPRRILQLRLEKSVKPLENDEPNIVSYEKAFDHKDIPVEHEAYDGEDEREDNVSKNCAFPGFELHARAFESLTSAGLSASGFSIKDTTSAELVKEITDSSENGDDGGGHVSDPGLGRPTAWVASPKLKRSCSSLETREVLSKFTSGLHCSDPQALHHRKESFEVVPGSHESVTSHKSADRVMLKKHSSKQLLPSRSRRLWWKLFLWSHRNLHNHRVSPKSQPLGVSVKNQHSGYASDFADHDQTANSSPNLFTDESTNNCIGFTNQTSNLRPHHNQWVAFSSESSSLKRVDEWVREINFETQVPINEDEDTNIFDTFPASPKTQKSPSKSGNVSEAIVHANNLVQSLSKSSSVAHISSIGLKAIPSISHFSSLRSLDLSNNFIVHITPASLPKGLHALNLSKNKISLIEGLRDLTRLRVLDLSYNRISRIGQGLSNCTLIKELYLAGNKISDVEGLHRLLKLIVLDLSFNKITTTKAIGQLVANYNSLLALNIIGNPIQSNTGEDHLRKTVCSLLPKLVYLNKQLTKPQRAREVLKDSVARAALGGGDSLHNHRRRTTTKRGGGSASPTVHRGHKGADKQKEKGHGSKERSKHHLRKTSAVETPTH